MPLPQDPYILLSVVNMRLRDEGIDLTEFCAAADVEPHALCQTLSGIGYVYHDDVRQFIRS